MDWQKADPEKTFRKLQPVEPGPAVLDNILREITSKVPVTRAWTTNPVTARMLWIAMAACACILIGLGIVRYVSRGQVPVGPQTNNDAITRNLASESFYILKTEPGQQESIVQDFDSFLIRRLRVGSKVGGFTLVSVENDALNLKGSDGVEGHYLVNDLNAEALGKLEEETVGLAQAFRAGDLQEADLERLKKISTFGEESALRLLEDIAESDSRWCSQSESILKANEEMAVVRDTIKWAKTGSRSSRVMSIRSLGRIQSPLAVQCLREIVRDSDEKLAQLALDTLVMQNDESVLKILDSLARELSDEKVRDRAAYHLTKLLNGVDREK
ncbi:HEAT repeat domain-containing protein [Planctomycetota bacterium]